jgi:hypothetical protein
MATSFPSGLDSFTNPTAVDTLDSPPHDTQHANANDAIEALQAKVGVNSSAVTTSHDYKIATLENAPTGRRNVVINGAMQVAQRGTSTASITSSGYYTADRWLFEPATMGTHTNSVENDAPTGSGFRKSFKVLVTTADAAPAAGDLLDVQTRFEGQNLQQFLKGTASAKGFTLTFWVKSNVTGTYVVAIRDLDNARSVSATYSVSASATWEKKTIFFPADTTGAFDNDNALSALLVFGLGAGTNYTSGTLNTTWASYTAANLLVGQTNLASATNNYWQITGVQLEVGDTATPFEHRTYGEELRLCQRYYEEFWSSYTGWPTSTTRWSFSLQWHEVKRATPTQTLVGGYVQYGPGGQQNLSSITGLQTHPQGSLLYATVPGGLTVNSGCVGAIAMKVDAEL